MGITTTGTVAKETIKNQVKRKHLEKWKGKPLHNYLFKKIEEQQEIDQRATSEWVNTGLSSHLEGYAAALQEQEIATRAIIKRRTKDQTVPMKCRLCKNQNEDIFHVIGSCPELSANLYTKSRHDPVAKIIYNETINEEHPQRIDRPPPVINTPSKEIWWNKIITTTNKIEHNRPDIVI